MPVLTNLVLQEVSTTGVGTKAVAETAETAVATRTSNRGPVSRCRHGIHHGRAVGPDRRARQRRRSRRRSAGDHIVYARKQRIRELQHRSSLSYTPNQDFTGVDTFTYVVADGRGGTATGSVTVTVSAPVIPSAWPEQFYPPLCGYGIVPNLQPGHRRPEHGDRPKYFTLAFIVADPRTSRVGPRVF